MSDQITVQILSGEQINVSVLPENDPIITLLDDILTGPRGIQGPPTAFVAGAEIPQPVIGDSVGLGRVQTEVVVSEVLAVLVGSVSPSAQVELRYSSSRSGVGTLFVNPVNVTNTTTGQALTPINQPIPPGSWLWAKVLNGTGVIDSLTITIAA